MNDKGKDYFVPEQLEDDDFEKEKLEEKKLKKFQKNNKQISDDEENSVKIVDKKKIFNVLAVILIVAFIVFEMVWYVIYGNLWTISNNKNASEPEQLAKDFCEYFNSGNWKELNESMDFKGYYILASVLKDDVDYPKFDIEYKQLDNDDEDYANYLETVELLKNIDEDVLKDFTNIRINLRSIESCNKIQGTDSLYKLRVTFEYDYNGDAQSITSVIFISNASGKYKMVYGEWMQTILEFYQSIYLQTNYNY